MDVRFAVGAEFDLVSKGELDDAVENIGGMFDKHAPPRPMFFTQTGSIQGLSGTLDTVCEIGSPPVGRIWNVLGYSVSAQTDATLELGRVSLYVGNPPDTGIPMLSQLKAVAEGVPTYDTFGENVIWCPPGQTIFVNVVGFTNVTQIVANAFVAEYREDDYVARTGR